MTLCLICHYIRKLLNSGPRTMEITMLEIVSFGTIRQKLAYLTKYFRICWTDLYRNFSVGRRLGGNDYSWHSFCESLIIVIIIIIDMFKVALTVKTRNAWQSLAYNPLGVVVSLPSIYLRNTPNYWSRQCLTVSPPSECNCTKCGKIIDVGKRICTRCSQIIAI